KGVSASDKTVYAGRERRQRQTVLLQGRVASAVGMHFNALQLLRIPRMEDVLNGRAALQQLRRNRRLQLESLIGGHRKHKTDRQHGVGHSFRSRRVPSGKPEPKAALLL